MTDPQPLNIAVICYHTNPFASPGSGEIGGMNVSVAHQMAELARRGHSVTVFTRRSSADMPVTEVVTRGVTLVALDAGEAREYPKGELPAFVEEFAENLASFVGESGLCWDVIHAQHWMSGVAVEAALRLIPHERHIPFVMSYHSIAASNSQTPLTEGERPEHSDRPSAEQYLAQHADVIAAVSRAEAATIAHRLDGFPDRIRVVHPGVDADAFTPNCGVSADTCHVRSAEGSRPVVLAAARLQPLKGLDTLLEAVSLLPVADRPRVQVAGGSSSDAPGYQEKLVELADRLGIADLVEFLGPVTPASMAQLMRDARVVAVPSHSETYGLVALEAAASGTAVIATDLGGLRESVRDGETGYRVPGHDPALWAEHISRLITDPDRATEMGRAGRAFALTRTWEISAEELLTVYREAQLRATLHEARSKNVEAQVVSPSLEQLRREGVVIVHAHPDDETISTGALLAALSDCEHSVSEHGSAANGALGEIWVVTATRGEMGEVREEAMPRLRQAGSLVALREQEISEALSTLTVNQPIQHVYLGQDRARATGHPDRYYSDSGMRWVTPSRAGADPDAGPFALTTTNMLEPVEDLAQFLRGVGAKWVLSYDELGTYGHPDHVRTQEIARVASVCAKKNYAQLVSPKAFAEATAPVISCAAYEARLREALYAYRSQLAVEGDCIRHVGGQSEPLTLAVKVRALDPLLCRGLDCGE